MENQTAEKKLSDIPTDERPSTSSFFETLRSLPASLYGSQCVVYNNEIIICGGVYKRDCYSYHTLKNQYKYICSYPANVFLFGHGVLKLANNTSPNEITLLSFGGRCKHTLVMKYVSVWDEDAIEKAKCPNEWIQFTDNQDNPICIGRNKDNYLGARAVICGSNNNLLFITYNPKNISVFDLTTFQFINHDVLQADNNWIWFHCFVSNNSNGLLTMSTNAKKNEMILFCEKIGLSIEYDEDSNAFQFNHLRICTTIRQFSYYAYVCVDDSILFFGGWNGCIGTNAVASKELYKYSITNNKWTKFDHTLPIALQNCTAVLDLNSTYIHILGGRDDKGYDMPTHVRIGVTELTKHETETEKQWVVEEEQKVEIEAIKIEMNATNQGFDITKLKVELIFYFVYLFVCLFRQKEIEMIVGYWVRSLFIEIGWIDDFTKIISRYLMMKYFKPLKVLQGHSNNVNSVKFSPDNCKIVSASDDQTVRIWDVKLGTEIKIFKGHADSVDDAQFSPDGKMIVSSSQDETVRLWDIHSGEQVKALEGHSLGVTCAQFSPDGTIIVSSSWDNTIRIWDAHSGEEIKTLEGHLDEVNDVQFAPDGQTIVSSSDDNTIGIWDVESGERIYTSKIHSNVVEKAQFSPDGQSIVSCSRDNTVLLWDVKSGKQLKKFEGHSNLVRCVKFSFDGQTIVSCSDDLTIRLWDVQFGMEFQELRGHFGVVTSVDVSPDGNAIVSSSEDGTIRLWGVL
ncbi:G-protein beta WD-40 repeats containing protein [Reticulomyxa filosa]|uniref:G-protein beta WD-40 repeats containing protein n=1 Tax=Reticulomyxa filosa TaxID=46433 RepID=X6NMS1_RETFI|nr:G-protein beta WD-40 repeats containing protein [Reticulomyxa filosa]|eukprot:ETO27233.1 G-protein beta WD-40 repeats containing protein [Reticulomyxa filosa]